MRRRLSALLCCLALLLAACGGADPDQATDDGPDAPDATPDVEVDDPEETDPTDDGTDADAADDPGDDADDVADSDGTADATAPDEPLGSSETSWGGIAGGDVRLDVLDVLRRGEDFLEVRLAITNVGEHSLRPYARLSAEKYEDDVSGLTVEDVDAGERLLVLRDSGGECVCSTDTDLSIPPGATRQFFARFPAPVSDRIDLAVPSFGTFNDLPVR